MADRIGQQLGHYRLVRLLGRGGFAEVYLGEHLRLKTQAAVKVLHTSLEEDDVEGFLREAQTVARLKHPHIVRVFDFDIEDHIPFLVMDYLPNGSIRRLYPKGTPLPLSAIVSYVTQIASALQYAHDEKVIHRDVKPENMLLDRDNTLLLSDFGIALMAQSSRYQSTQQVAGTAAYMAPEQFQGHPHRASDQYALGVVVYEWLSGDRPFHGLFGEIASQHMFVPPPPLSEKVPTISSAIEQVVRTALEKDTQKRFGSVLAFATALEQACQAIPPQQVALPTEVPIPSEPSLPSTVSATVLPTQLPQATNVDTPPGQSLPPTIAAIPFHPPDVSPPLTRESVPSIESQSLRQSQHLISRRVVVVGLAGLAVVGLASGSLLWLARSQQPTAPTLSIGTTLYTYRGHSSGVNAVAWSPDGKYIASAAYDKTVQVWDAADGVHVYTYRGHSDYVSAVAWSPDSKRIASAGYDATVQVWDAADGGNVYTYRGHYNRVSAVAWSPDGKRIASGSYPYDATVQVWDAADGGNVYTYRGQPGYANVYAVAWSPDSKRIASSTYLGVQVWDAADGSHVHSYPQYVGPVAWSPDGKYIVASPAYERVQSEYDMQVWDAATGNRKFTCTGHSSVVSSVAWSPDGKYIASGYNDATVQVWDAADGGNVYTYREHPNPVYASESAVAWSPDSKYIASGCNDSTTVQVWQAV